MLWLLLMLLLLLLLLLSLVLLLSSPTVPGLTQHMQRNHYRMHSCSQSMQTLLPHSWLRAFHHCGKQLIVCNQG